mmetsp:Transcript_57998/g.96176  ORF Transcript_57998/g.96176 Transcript_57998/m.96176 type:complete len:568 (-) Transcript_57998:29-1732(-)|eukprot:CAMPEP_0202689616 /NCGR_PEP_ID=MMETSP1385-20130828/4825_1 /ASSEMBLY_ACC=CAM_ASM_000861 /TAXON_ID=933848 /ORGANISM="Elphidium margaritaceum" /LENGTH=567 /DNA_ID=CAMNT_0049344765 /DNA_START=504 /DNA_END=2207 /DNA_ORIENTATION=-
MTDATAVKNEDDMDMDKEKYGKKSRHAFMDLYWFTLPLAAIFLLDILPSRVSLIVVGHLTENPLAFNSIFLSYSFTNFFAVFVLSLSCGLDTLTKTQLRDISYIRCALLLVIIGFVPYIVCCVMSVNILRGLNQPAEIIESTAHCINYLIVYAVCYIIFAMLRKSLLQYLHTTLLIGLMLARFFLHLMIGWALYYYTSLDFYAFLVSDSVSMCTLLVVTVLSLSRMVSLGKFVCDLFRPNTSAPLSAAAAAAAASGGSRRGSDGAAPRNIMSAGTPDAESFQLTRSFDPDSQNYMKQYVNATLIPGAISCLEWWAVETFTFLVGALSYSYTSKENIFFTHACWASFLLLFQMPMLGLSVAMASLMTSDIRSGKFYPAWYTFLQAMVTVILYCVGIALLVTLGYDQIINMFYPVGTYAELTDDDVLHNSFNYQVLKNSSDISTLFVVALCGYAIAMSFLGIFVAVGRLARGGTFMLIGYYVFGLILAIILGYVAEWKFYGIWFGLCGAFVVWCVLSALYWMCTDWFYEMKTMKAGYDLMETQQKNVTYPKVNNYGSTQTAQPRNQSLL